MERNEKGQFVKGVSPYNSKEKIKKECEICGKGFKVIPSRKDSAKFCSKECMGKNKTKTLKGNNFAEGREPNQTSFENGHTPWNKGEKYDEEMKEKLDMSGLDPEAGKKTRFETGDTKGKENINWKGGIVPLNSKIRKIDNYKEWRKAVFERDDYTCQECGERQGNINAHHIKELSDIMRQNDIESLNDAKECGELWNVDNGITLCEKCHQKKHSNLVKS